MALISNWPWEQIIDEGSLPDFEQACSEARAAGLSIGHEGLEDGMTLLMACAEAGWIEACRLIAQESDPDAESEDGETALALAIGEDHEEVALFLAEVSSVSKSLPSGESTIHLAMAHEMDSVALALVERASSEVFAMRDQDGDSVLIAAILLDCQDVALRIAQLAEPFVADLSDSDGDRAFKLAIDEGWEACALALAGKVDPKLSDSDGLGPFERAMQGEHWHCAAAIAPRTNPMSRRSSEDDSAVALDLAWNAGRHDLAAILAAKPLPRHLLLAGCVHGSSILHRAIAARDAESAWAIAERMGQEMLAACCSSSESQVDKEMLLALKGCLGDSNRGRSKWISQARSLAETPVKGRSGGLGAQGALGGGLAPGQTQGWREKVASWWGRN